MKKNYDNENIDAKSFRKERWIWASAVIIILFLFIFSMFHLPQRGKDETDNIIAELNYSPDEGESFDFQNCTSSELRDHLESLQLQYDNAKVNGDYLQIETAGMNLAMAYLKAHDRQQAATLLHNLCLQFSYDTPFVGRCQRILDKIY